MPGMLMSYWGEKFQEENQKKELNQKRLENENTKRTSSVEKN